MFSLNIYQNILFIFLYIIHLQSSKPKEYISTLDNMINPIVINDTTSKTPKKCTSIKKKENNIPNSSYKNLQNNKIKNKNLSNKNLQNNNIKNKTLSNKNLRNNKIKNKNLSNKDIQILFTKKINPLLDIYYSNPSFNKDIDINKIKENSSYYNIKGNCMKNRNEYNIYDKIQKYKEYFKKNEFSNKYNTSKIIYKRFKEENNKNNNILKFKIQNTVNLYNKNSYKRNNI